MFLKGSDLLVPMLLLVAAKREPVLRHYPGGKRLIKLVAQKCFVETIHALAKYALLLSERVEGFAKR